MKQRNDGTPLSEAIQWFHGSYDAQQSIKGSELTGWSARRGVDSQVGRIWHRMYPHYVKNRAGKLIQIPDEYIELLTIFPDDSKQTSDFLAFLNTGSSGFSKLWGGE